MKPSFFQRIKVKLKLFRALVHTLIRILLYILLVLTLIYILIISIPELFENIINFLMGLLKSVINSIIGFFEYIINSSISTIMQGQVISKIYQIISLLFLFVIVSLIFNKIFKITDWAQPTILSLSKKETRLIVIYKIAELYSLFNKYEKEKKEIIELEATQKKIRNEINKVLNIINNYEKRKPELIFQEKYGNKLISRTSKTEKDILLRKIIKENEKKVNLEDRSINLEKNISDKKTDLEEINQEARATIIENYKEKRNYYNEKYRNYIKVRNKLINYFKDLPLIIFKGIMSAFNKLI